MSIIKIVQSFFLFLIVFLLFIVVYLFLGKVPKTENPEFGIVFSQKHARDLGLNWQITYKELLNLGVKDLRLITHWDLIEPEKNKFNFKNLDWQLLEAEKRDVDVVLVIGMKTGRWPECHIPSWAKELSEEEQKERIIKLLKVLTARYKESKPVVAWAVENEPLFSFGDCPWIDKEFLKEEIETVRSVDSYYKRPIMISDSGEGSFWIEAAKLGDIVSVTMYRKVWLSNFKTYFDYPFPPFFYWKKRDLINNFFEKEVICSELQTEPWCPNLLYNCSLEEQAKSFTIDEFRENVEFAKQTGFDKFYLWGAEWWFWMKEEQKQPQIWNEAKKLF